MPRGQVGAGYSPQADQNCWLILIHSRQMTNSNNWSSLGSTQQLGLQSLFHHQRTDHKMTLSMICMSERDLRMSALWQGSKDSHEKGTSCTRAMPGYRLHTYYRLWQSHRTGRTRALDFSSKLSRYQKEDPHEHLWININWDMRSLAACIQLTWFPEVWRRLDRHGLRTFVTLQALEYSSRYHLRDHLGRSSYRILSPQLCILVPFKLLKL